MIKLTPTQLSLLATAGGRADGGLTRPSNLRSAVAAKVAAKLIEQKLVRETRAKAHLPVWREDEAGRRFSLTILKGGRTAIRAASGKGEADAPESIGRRASAPADTLMQATAVTAPGSKRALVVSLLQRPDGVTIKDLMAATGWLPHTTRAALTGLRKTGLTIDRHRAAETQSSVYRLATAVTEAA